MREDIQKILKEFVERCKNKFGENLVSVILFGSYARGTANEYSDVDLLVVVRKLPRKRIERYRLLGDVIHEILMKYSIRISPVLIEPKDLSKRNVNPLIYGILVGYKVLYQKDNFWTSYLNSIKDVIKENKPIYIEGAKRWEIEKLI